MSLAIREYCSTDAAAIERCIVELQEYERTLELNRADPLQVAGAYRESLLAHCGASRGQIYVAEEEGTIVGFVCVLAAMDSEDVLELQREHAYVTDLVVMASRRGEGVGSALLRAAERYVLALGAQTLELDVLAANDLARRFYEEMGYAAVELRLKKVL